MENLTREAQHLLLNMATPEYSGTEENASDEMHGWFVAHGRMMVRRARTPIQFNRSTLDLLRDAGLVEVITAESPEKSLIPGECQLTEKGREVVEVLRAARPKDLPPFVPTPKR